ncbi:hypothetical protein SB78_02885 [Rickettsia asembonensis]|uniref:Outer membrane protein A n=1 Tax=Rickettsia asembonensis TaxID=1068590 RepID=A0A0C2MNW1_9RICK|nr:hypothetical protein [Rickettsia asembonensis]KIJ88896.1 hypothetical protein SB78_02885 [Rickettsia asembonensis]
MTNTGSALTLADGVTLTGVVTTNNNTKGILVLGAGSSVTGGIGGNNAALERVTLGAGASSLGGNIYSGAVALTDQTSILTLQDGAVTGNVGAVGSALEEVVFNGADNIGDTANAETFTVANAAANTVITGLATGALKYTDTGTITANGGWTGDIDFNNKAGTFELDDGAMIDGSVLGTGGVAGTLNFIGDGNVTGNIGTDAANSPANINIQGDNTKNVTIANDIFVGNINFTNGGVLQLSGNLTTPNIDFGANGGTLEFNGNNTYNLNAVIANGQNDILNVFTTLKSTEASIGTVKTINIGQVFRKRRETPEP